MQYLPAINLWDPKVISDLRKGILRLQSGQWVRCGHDGPLSRFDRIDHQSGHVRAFHWPDAGPAYLDFKKAAELARVRLERAREARSS